MTNHYKLLGVIGGMGPWSSAHFYERIVQKTKVVKDSDHINMVISSIATTPDRTAYLIRNEENPYDTLKSVAIKLKTFGADIMIIICNTAHFFIERLEREVGVPFINIITTTLDFAVEHKIERVGIMATTGNIETKLYENACLDRKIIPIIPSQEIQDKIMNLIYDNIKKGEPISQSNLNDIVAYFVKMRCDKVILGCTELSILSQTVNNDFFLDPLEITADYCIKKFNKIPYES